MGSFTSEHAIYTSCFEDVVPCVDLLGLSAPVSIHHFNDLVLSKLIDLLHRLFKLDLCMKNRHLLLKCLGVDLHNGLKDVPQVSLHHLHEQHIVVLERLKRPLEHRDLLAPQQEHVSRLDHCKDQLIDGLLPLEGHETDLASNPHDLVLSQSGLHHRVLLGLGRSELPHDCLVLLPSLELVSVVLVSPDELLLHFLKLNPVVNHLSRVSVPVYCVHGKYKDL